MTDHLYECKVRCGSAYHTIAVTRGGQLRLLHHPKQIVNTEEIATMLTGEECSCLKLLRLWKNRTSATLYGIRAIDDHLYYLNNLFHDNKQAWRLWRKRLKLFPQTRHPVSVTIDGVISVLEDQSKSIGLTCKEHSTKDYTTSKVINVSFGLTNNLDIVTTVSLDHSPGNNTCYCSIQGHLATLARSPANLPLWFIVDIAGINLMKAKIDLRETAKFDNARAVFNGKFLSFSERLRADKSLNRCRLESSTNCTYRSTSGSDSKNKSDYWSMGGRIQIEFPDFQSLEFVIPGVTKKLISIRNYIDKRYKKIHLDEK